jgi:hypothetical protein
MRGATLAHDFKIVGLEIQKDSHIWFHKNGRVAEVTLSSPQVIQGVSFAQGQVVQFKENGDLK